MAKLSKAQAKAHREALDLLAKDRLTLEELDFFYENYNEAAEHEVGAGGAFFTPLSLASDFRLDVWQGGRIVDICAGIGALSHVILNWNHWSERETPPEITCIELNPRYVEIGRKLLPQARWICADALDPATWRDLGRFDYAISNPPFGAPASYRHKSKAAGGRMEYAVIEQASRVAEFGAFIIPQGSAPFRYSGAQCFQLYEDGKAAAFTKKTGIEMHPGAGVDTSIFRDQWKNTAPLVEIVTCEFDQPEEQPAKQPAKIETSAPAQLDLFAA